MIKYNQLVMLDQRVCGSRLCSWIGYVAISDALQWIAKFSYTLKQFSKNDAFFKYS